MQHLLEDMRAYFEGKTSLTQQEQSFLRQLKDGDFSIASVSREDLQSIGFDTRSVTDNQMCHLAKKMSDDYLDQLYWSSMRIIAEGLDFPLHPKCPACNCRRVILEEQRGTFRCKDCDQEWHENLFVLAEFPDDTAYFEQNDIGYPSFESEDNGARYIPEYDYICHFKKKPKQNKYFKPLSWPESQPYLYPDEPDDSIDSLNEPVTDDCGIEDFGENAVWVPLCKLKK